MKVKDCMCNNVTYVTPENTVCDCARVMCEKHIGCVPVCDCNKNILGLVTDRDVLLRAIANNKNINDTQIKDIMTKNVCCCEADNDLGTAQKIMSENQVRRLPVIENNKVVGILTIGDLTNNENVNTQDVVVTLENICNCNKKNAE